MASSREITDATINELINLSRLLGEFGQILRVTKLPNGELETDSHHSFNVALTAFQLAAQFAPELDSGKILLYSLVHDLPEMITGDMNTLTASTLELHQKADQDAVALEQIAARFQAYPAIVAALRDYEAGKDEESHWVYWIDKLITIPQHFHDQGANLRHLGINNRADITAWYARRLEKMNRRTATPHPAASKLLEKAYLKMRAELLAD